MSGFAAAVACGSAIAILDTQTVTRGQTTSGASYVIETSGYRTTGTVGSISDGTSNLYSGAAINELYFKQINDQTTFEGYITRQLILKIAGTLANSGWATMLVGTTEFQRTGAAFTTDGTYSTWTWDIAIPNPFLSENDPFTASTVVKWY